MKKKIIITSLLTASVLLAGLASAISFNSNDTLFNIRADYEKVFNLEAGTFISSENEYAPRSKTVSTTVAGGGSYNVTFDFSSAKYVAEDKLCQMAEGSTLTKTTATSDMKSISAVFDGSLRIYCSYSDDVDENCWYADLTSGDAKSLKGNYFMIKALAETTIESISFSYGCLEATEGTTIRLKEQDDYARWVKVGNDYLLEIEGYYRGQEPVASALKLKDGDNEVTCSSIDTNNGEFTAKFDVYGMMIDKSITNAYHPHLYVNGAVYFSNNGDLGKDVEATISDSGFITSDNKVVSIVDNGWGFFSISETSLNIGSASNCKPALSNDDNETDLLFSINVTTDTSTLQYTDLPKVASSLVNPEAITLVDNNWTSNVTSTSRDDKLLRVTFNMAHDGVLYKTSDSSVREDIYPHVAFNGTKWDGDGGNIPTSGDTSYYFKHEGGFIRYGSTNSYYALTRQAWGTYIRRIDHISFDNHFSIDNTNKHFEIGFCLEKANNDRVKLTYGDDEQAINNGWTGEGCVFNSKFTINSWFDENDSTVLTVKNIWFSNNGEFHAQFNLNDGAVNHDFNNGDEYRMDARLNFDGSPVTSDGKVTCWSDSENWSNKGTIYDLNNGRKVEFYNTERYLRIAFKNQ